MPTSIKLLHEKAAGTVAAFTKLTARQREQSLSAVAAEDFNKLRELVLEAKPDLHDVVPPVIPIEQDGPHTIVKGNYQDLHAFMMQIEKLTNPGTDRLPPTRLTR